VKIYAVGGAVRDELLGLPVKDRDYVVVGATPEDMTRLGYKPVGKDFPVFLHPKTHEEYALARTERKTARGYKGFQVHAAPDVTLEQDLSRRDLTINAIARDAQGRIIDPCGGAADLKRGVLRHVSPAFAEDPVRILRVARFAARFGFKVAPATLRLMRAMVEAGEADALVPERVWQELAIGLMEPAPSKMFALLRSCGALARVLPDLAAAWASRAQYARTQRALDFAAVQGYALSALCRARLRARPHRCARARIAPHERAPARTGGLARSGSAGAAPFRSDPPRREARARSARRLAAGLRRLAQAGALRAVAAGGRERLRQRCAAVRRRAAAACRASRRARRGRRRHRRARTRAAQDRRPAAR